MRGKERACGFHAMTLAGCVDKAYRESMKSDQITELEIQTAHQARQLEELDEVVRDQAERRVLARRLQESAEPASGSVVLGGQDKPPHY